MTARLLAAALLALAAALVLPAPASACSCVAQTGTAYADRADVVFRATIVQRRVDERRYRETFTFEVERVFKGSAYARQVVTAPWASGCSMDLPSAGPIDVFAHQEGSALSIDDCWGTGVASVPAGLGPGRPPAANPPESDAGPGGSWLPLAGGLLALAAAAALDVAMRRRSR